MSVLRGLILGRTVPISSQTVRPLLPSAYKELETYTVFVAPHVPVRYSFEYKAAPRLFWTGFHFRVLVVSPLVGRRLCGKSQPYLRP